MNSRLLIPTLAIAVAATLPTLAAAQVTGSLTGTGSTTTNTVSATTSGSVQGTTGTSGTGSTGANASGSSATTGSSTSPSFPNTGAGGTWLATMLAILGSAAAAVGASAYLRRSAR